VSTTSRASSILEAILGGGGYLDFCGIVDREFKFPPRTAVGGAKGGPGQNKNEPLIFHFTKGSPAELDITMPESKMPPKPRDDEDQAVAMQAMQQIFKDMKITMAWSFRAPSRRRMRSTAMAPA
jgi:hypothetical protein